MARRPERLGFRPGSSFMSVRRGEEAHLWQLLLLFVHMFSSISCNINSRLYISFSLSIGAFYVSLRLYCVRVGTIFQFWH